MINYLGLILTLFLFGCHESKSTEQGSDAFSSLKEKREFLNKYKKLDGKSFQKLDFYISFKDNSGGMVPGPSDWDICIVAEVPEDEIDLWIKGLNKLEQKPEINCFEKIPTDIDYSGVSEWYEHSANSFIGLDRNQNIIVYRNQKY